MQSLEADGDLSQAELSAMAKDRNSDPAFEIAFFESVLRRDGSYTDVIEILGGSTRKAGASRMA